MEWIIGIIALLLGCAVGFIVNNYLEAQKREKESSEAQNSIEAANKRAEEIINNATKEAKSLTLELRNKAEEEIKERKQENLEQERRLNDLERRLNDIKTSGKINCITGIIIENIV